MERTKQRQVCYARGAGAEGWGHTQAEGGCWGLFTETSSVPQVAPKYVHSAALLSTAVARRPRPLEPSLHLRNCGETCLGQHGQRALAGAAFVTSHSGRAGAKRASQACSSAGRLRRLVRTSCQGGPAAVRVIPAGGGGRRLPGPTLGAASRPASTGEESTRHLRESTGTGRRCRR